MTKKWRQTIAILFLVCAARMARAAHHDWTEQINTFKPMVVNIEASNQIAFEDESRGTLYATGVVVDSERGIIATNEHVIQKSPSSVKINFANGSSLEARPLYYDPSHDFGFYKFDPSKVNFKLQAATLGTGRNVKIGDELLLIGNNDRQEYSIKFGNVANPNVNKGSRYSRYIHTTFDRTGGSSGSPVWNTKGEVVAIHASGTDVSSFELISDYVRDALTKIQKGAPIRRGGIGVVLQHISIGDAIQYFRMPASVRSELRLLRTEVTKVIQVESVIPKSVSEGLLRAGDIVYRVGGDLAKDDFYAFDQVLNDLVGSTVDLEIFRYGKLVKVKVPVRDMELSKITRFVRFAGAVFHELTPYQRRNVDFAGPGVYMPSANAGSSFSSLGARNEKGNYCIVVSEIGGNRVESLDDFISMGKTLKDQQHVVFTVRDCSLRDRAERARGLTIVLKYNPLAVYQWNPQTLEWDKTN